MKTSYLDLRYGVAGDMFIAACCSLLEDNERGFAIERIQEASKNLGGEALISVKEECGMTGLEFVWIFSEEGSRAACDAMEILEKICEDMGASRTARAFSMKVFEDILAAETQVHAVPRDELHLHELGRQAALMNIACAGFCVDLLGLQKERVIASYIAIGDGEIITSHGKLSIPTPVSTRLLRGLRFRFGPEEGEMATPTGIAIVRNIIMEQIDCLPDFVGGGIGFGTGRFGGKTGYVHISKTDTNCGGHD